MYCSYLLLEIYVQYYISSYILHVTLKSDILVTYYVSLLLLLYVTYVHISMDCKMNYISFVQSNIIPILHSLT